MRAGERTDGQTWRTYIHFSQFCEKA